MNYTGRPSISGCRPVLPLYPTHRFCQYLLGIFITFTNSSLFCRAFSTNSRSPLRRAAGVTVPGCALSGASRQLPQRERSSTSPSRLRRATARVAAPSVCFAVARILLAAAPTAPPCFRHWRRSSPLLLPRGGFGSPRRVNGFARGSPTRGAVERSETERLYEGEPFLCRKVRLLASPVSFWRKEWYNGFAALPAHLFGRGGEKNGKYSFFYTVCRSKCSSLLYLQVA